MYDLFAFVFQNSFLLRGIILFVFGTIIGSFLNVVIYRLPLILKRKWHNDCVMLLGESSCPLIQEQLSLIHPGSHCPKCRARVPLWANIPLLGYFLLNGKCFKCKLKISIRYPLIELMTAILFVIAGYLTSDTLVLPALLIFISFIICLSFIDYETFILPDELTLPLLWLGLIFNLHGAIAQSLANAVIGAIIGYLSLWSIFWLFKLVTKREGMGYGDFKLFAAILAWVGYRGLIPIALVASILGIVYFIVLHIIGKMHYKINITEMLQYQIPFGPFLGIASFIFIFADKYFINFAW